MKKTKKLAIAAIAIISSAAFIQSPALAQKTTQTKQQAQNQTPNAIMEKLTQGVLETLKNDKKVQQGDFQQITQIVDSQIMPNVNFARMTASATGPAWRSATPAQKTELQKQFKTLLVHTYSGALKQVKNQTVELLPTRAAPQDTEVVVRTLIQNQNEPIQVDYRLEKTPNQGLGWKIYDMNVLGVWLVDSYRPQFAQQINSGGIPALIAALEKRNTENTAQNAK